MESVDCSDEVQKLREQLRLLSSQNTSLKRENSNLNEKLSSDASRTSKAEFTITLEPTTQETPIITDSVMMGNVAVTMIGDYLVDNDGVRVFHVWLELVSPTQHSAAVMTRITYRIPGNVQAADEPVHSEFIQLERESTARSSRIAAKNIKSTRLQAILTVHVKLIKSIREDTVSFADGDATAKLVINEETIPVSISIISLWSEYFRGYFASSMKESKEGLYPVEDCTAAEFREMLDVIYPGCKSINHWNVESMLRLADRFIMPSLSRKCEIFLTDRSKHNFSDSELLKLADDYRLAFMKMIVLECTTADQLHKNVIAKDEYKSYSEELKKAIDTRYVESKVPERNKC